MANPLLGKIAPRNDFPIHRREKQRISVIEGRIDRNLIVTREIGAKQRSEVDASRMAFPMGGITRTHLKGDLLKLFSNILTRPNL